MAYREEDNNAGKILLAALAGASAGIVAGILLAPDKGSVTLDNWKGAAKDAGAKLGDQYKQYSADLETKFQGLAEKISGLTGGLDIAGNWDSIKGQLKQKYGQLTDEDLTLADGKVDELLGRLEQKLGISKDEITKVISDLVAKVKEAVSKGTDAVKDAVDKGTDAAKDAVGKGADAAKTAAK
ncbi:MAG: CsbD family protein [Hymenobacter sp.]|nr:MAG: CsbD family protein [Hymenobacter sp.]